MTPRQLAWLMIKAHDDIRASASYKQGPGSGRTERRLLALWLEAGDARLSAWAKMSEPERRAMRVAIRRSELEDLHEHERGAMFE